MTLLFVASRFHEANPRRGVAVQALGLVKALRRAGETVELVDPFGLKDGDATERVLGDLLRTTQPRAIVVMGRQRSSWTGWSVLGAYQGEHSVPMACIDVEDPVCTGLADICLSSQLIAGQEGFFLPPAVDPEVYRPLSADRDLAYNFVGRIGRLRHQMLSLVRPLPGFTLDSGQDQEPRVPQHALASIMARSVVGLDLLGKRIGAVHSRVFEALSTSTFPLAPWSEALCACLDPGKEVFVYRDTGEMVEMVHRINSDPESLAETLIAGRRRVLAEHSFAQRAQALLSHLGERALSMPAEPSQSKKVTVFMPVFDAEAWVGDAVGSLLGQTHRNLHILAVNDGSRDRSSDVLRALAAKDRRLQVIDYDTNRGEAVRRNDALAHVPEDTVYMSDHDADDLSDPSRIERQVAFLEANPQVHCVGAQARILDNDGGLRDYLRLPTSPEEIDATFHLRNSIVHTAGLFRRSVMDRVIGYRNSFRSVDDYEFFARMLECGYRIANLPDVLVSRRDHRGSISKTLSRRQEYLRRQVADRLEQSLSWRLACRQGRSKLRVHLAGTDEGTRATMLVQASDIHAEIRDDFRFLRLPAASCSDLWLSQCLEQLPRAAGMRALMEWHTWLEEDGRLVLETLDFSAMLEGAMDGRYGPPEFLRQLFGDQVNGGASRDAYDQERLVEVLSRIGFEIEAVGKTVQRGRPYAVIECRKRKISSDEQNFAALDLLEDFLLDASEVGVREAWHKQLNGEPGIGSNEPQGGAVCTS